MTKGDIKRFGFLRNSPFLKGEYPMKEAYCVELDKIVTAAEAWTMLFGDEGSRIKKRSLTFACPDPKCRATLLASNLRELSSPSEVYFKTHLKAVHEPYCVWTSKTTLGIEIASPEQAKEILFVSLGYLYKHILSRLERIEKKYL